MGDATRWGRRLILLAAATGLSGCLIASNSTTSFQGTRAILDERTIEQIEPGETTEAWVRSVFGDPASCEQVDEDTRILEYRCVKERRDGVTVFLLLAANNTREFEKRLFIEVADGVVTKTWQTNTQT